MALPGYYLINFTDPRKQSFIIEPYQTDGGISPTSPIPHGSARRISTSLLLYGRDVPNYGERIAENFVQLLENFAGPKDPQSPLEGQMWFDTGSSYDIVAWTNATTLTLSGNVQAEFAKYVADAMVLTLAFRPVNAVVDNSYQQVSLLPTTVAAAGGNTVVTFTAADGQPIELPATVVGGFIAADTEQYSRMRVATKVGADIKWVDVTNVYSSEDEPEIRHRQVGDLWLDTDVGQLMVYGTGGWVSVAAKYLPIVGGTMEGDVQMGTHRIFSSAVTDNTPAHQYALVNRTYVDGVRTSLQTQIDTINGSLGDLSGSGLAGKVSKAGDSMTGALVFGAGNPAATVPLGIDMNGTPLVRLSITWNSADYLSASLQPTYATTKEYVAKAFQQHLLDEEHGAGGFIQVQGDGTGLIPNSVFFNAGTAGSTYALTWKDVSGNNEHKIYANFSGVSSQFIIEAGSDSSDSVDIRHSLQSPAADPLFRFGNTFSRSFNSLYIHDGQPQPESNDVPTAIVDDNKAATKGFVRQYVTDNMPTDTGGGAGTTVTSVTYAYNVVARTYSLTLFQDGLPPISVNEYHRHDSYDVPFMYSMPDYDWLQFDTDVLSDFIQTRSPNYPETTVGDVLEGLVAYKAPVEDAIFVNLPRVGSDVDVIEYNTSLKTIRVDGDIVSTMFAGLTVQLTDTIGNDGLYTVSDVAAGADIAGEPTTIITVVESLAVNGAETNSGFLTVGLYASETQPRALVTRTTLDYELDKATEVKYAYWKATSAGSNIVRALGFTYTLGKNKLWIFKNGQKLRVGIISGGDFNETSTTTVTLATVAVDDEFEFYEI